MKTRNILTLLMTACLCLFIGAAVAPIININPFVSGTVLFAAMAANQYSINLGLYNGITLYGLAPEMWVRQIEENLFANNEFISMSINDSSFITAGNKKVHVPQSGSKPGIVKNRVTFPATITERADSDLEYDIDSFTTDPIRVRNLEELQTSYKKRANVLEEHVEALAERLGDETSINWATSVTRVLLTTGAQTADKPTGATGTRRKVLKEDIGRLSAQLDADNVVKAGRSLLMPTSMFYELFEIDALIRKDFGQAANLVEGAVTRIFGFDVFLRSSLVLHNGTTLAKIPFGTAPAITDSFSILAWQKTKVSFARNTTKVFLNEGRAEHYGDLMSAEVEHGSARRRSDDRGVIVLTQNPA